MNLSELEDKNLDVVSLVEAMWPFGEARVQEWFAARGFEFHPPLSVVGTPHEHSVFQIMYTQRTSTIDWRPIWARQCRGIVLYIQEEDRRQVAVKVLRYLLQRGEEVITSFHTATAKHHLPVELSECTTDARMRWLDERQRETIRQLSEGRPAFGQLSMKVDGMLCAWTFYRGDMAGTLLDIINSSCDANLFASPLVKACQQSSKEYIAVLSSQRTLLISDVRTQSYVLSALLSSICLGDELRALLKEKGMTVTPSEALSVFASRLVDAMDGFYDPSGASSQSICFEAVCGRGEEGFSTCAWGQFHDEFALSYTSSFVAILSRSEDLVSTPHYKFSNKIQSLGFIEPLWWDISHTVQINCLLQQLTNVALGEMSCSEFLLAHPPRNIEPGAGSSDNLLHLEGFVFYARTSTGGSHYNKIKLPLYYILHSGHNETQTREEDVQTLAIVGRTNPQLSAKARATAAFFDSLEKKLKMACNDLIEECNLQLEENSLYRALAKDQQKAVQQIWKQPGKARRAWHILLSCSSTMAVPGQYPVLWIFVRHFPELKRTKMKIKEVNKLLRLLIYEIQPWEKNYMANIASAVISFDRLLRKLYTALTWATKETEKDAHIVAYFQVGCPESTDVDIMVQLDSPFAVEKAARGDIDLRHKLSGMTGKPVQSLDLNYFFVGPLGRAQNFSKGTRNLSSNILFQTYNLHEQHFPLPIAQPELPDLQDMIRGFIAFVLKELKDLVGLEVYQKARSQRMGAYTAKGGTMRRDFVLSMLPYIREINSDYSRDVIKSLTMKSIQILCIFQLESCPFVKAEMSETFEQLYAGQGEHARFHLFRGRKGSYSSEFLPFLMAEVARFINEAAVTVKWNILPVQFNKNPSRLLPDELHVAFWDDPTRPTNEFRALFRAYRGDQLFQDWFLLESMNVTALPPSVATVLPPNADLDSVDNLVGPVVFTCPQRSNAWKLTRNRFPNSSNGASAINIDTSDALEAFHLFRGCLVEMSVTANADFTAIPGLDDIELVTVGCVVDASHTTNQSPDFLLVKRQENKTIIMPGEIKCSPKPFRENAELRRTLQQSSRQLRGVAEMLDLLPSQGVLVLVNIQKEGDVVVVESRVSLLNLSSRA